MLIEDGNYSEALNLTTRLLAMYGQGPGQMGYPSKHTKHSLQVLINLIIFIIIYSNRFIRILCILGMAYKILIVGKDECLENCQ